MGPKICHLTSGHPAFDIRIFRKECRSLADAGYEVVLVAPHERDETVDGVRIRCVPRPRDRRERMTRTPWHVLEAALAEDAALYHFHDPELIPVGMMLKARGKRVFYDVHENVPGSILTRAYLPPAARPWIAAGAGLVEGLGTRMFDGVVAATPAIARRFAKHGAIVVQNFPIPDELAVAQPRPYSERERLVAYVGVMSEIRGIPEMVKAMALLPSSTEAILALAGMFGSPGLETELSRQPGWARVHYLGLQSRDEVATLLNRSRLGLVVFLAGPYELESLPNKLLEYMPGSRSWPRTFRSGGTSWKPTSAACW